MTFLFDHNFPNFARAILSGKFVISLQGQKDPRLTWSFDLTQDYSQPSFLTFDILQEMKFELLLKKLKKLNLPSDQFAVMSSGVLAVKGLREARDLDLVVTRKLWSTLSSKYPIERHDKGYFISLDKNIEAVGGRLESQGKDFIQMEEQIKKANIIDGVRYVKLGDVIKFKKRLGRKKDFKDIALIDKFLKGRKSNG